MLRAIPSLRMKIMLIVLVTTLAALLFAGIVLVAHDVRSHQSSWAGDLLLQAEVVGRTSAPAIVFHDTLTAHQSLALLSIRREIREAAVYDQGGRLFSTWARPGARATFPDIAGAEGYRFDRDRLVLFKAVRDADERVGTVYLLADYDRAGRLSHYLPVLGLVLLASLLVALGLTTLLESAVTRPVLAIADVAQQVKTRGDLSLRVRKETRDETGQLVDAFNAMLVEVSEAHQSLLDSNRRKDEFLATLAHELRNPLGPIRNAAQYLRMKGTDPASRPSLELIDRQVQHMVRLIEDLLDISRITRDALELRRSEFSVGELVGDVKDATQFAVDEASQKLRWHVERGDLRVNADRARLVQVVCNLVNNAIKYTPRGGEIDVDVSSHRRELMITVKDSGIGIPPDKLRDIFEPFSQLDRSLEKTRGGLGIGLALSERLVALHGGTVSASSEGPGKGSTFEVTMPIVTEVPATPRQDLTRLITGESRHILVADDNLDGAESLALLLGAMGHRVETAHDGVEALESLKGQRYDAAILDIGMPRLNGYDLAREIRAQPWGRAIYLVALTGWGQAEDKQRAMDAGFDRHLTKPVQPEQLAAVLAEP
ncbi:MAG TPA: ATP-binding protein [Candidatus Eisenbacteria bacterium]|nr:ATP-binding protein [Candidatus Eisenbacteria bacterium]